jgi:hypothetical protein
MIDRSDEYNLTVQGETPPPWLLAILNQPDALLARAAVRIAIAKQDDALGDTLAAWRNRAVATAMLLASRRRVP